MLLLVAGLFQETGRLLGSRFPFPTAGLKSPARAPPACQPDSPLPSGDPAASKAKRKKKDEGLGEELQRCLVFWVDPGSTLGKRLGEVKMRVLKVFNLAF